MIERIGGLPSPTGRPSEDIKIHNLAREIHKGISEFIDDVRKVVSNPGLLDHPEFLEHLAQQIQNLSTPAREAAHLHGEMRMLEENVQDAGDIIQNILTQPLIIPGEKKDYSLLEAAQTYTTKSALTSHLRKILISFVQFPEPTEILLRELELLKDGLEVR